MEKRFRLVLSFVVLFLGCFVGNIHAQEYAGEQITEFVTDVTFNEDSSIDVKEKIYYYFPYEKHGIYREIPVDYRVGGSFKRKTQLKLNSLIYYPEDNTDSVKSKYSTSFKNGYRIYQIGEEDAYVQGEYVYELEYNLKYAVNYFDDHDELYLNITGDSWIVPIKSATATIHLPAEATEYICYTGDFGSTQQNCSIDDTDKKNLKITLTQPLDAYEGYTVAVKLPVGTVANTEGEQRIQWMLANIGIFLPIPVFIFVLSYVKKNGQNKKGTIIPHYHPPKGLTPTLSGYLYSKRLDSKYLTANIIDLAVRGYLKIKQVSKRKYELIRTSKKSDGLDKVEKDLISGIFGSADSEGSIQMDKLRSDFYKTVNSITTTVSKQVYEKDLFSKERKKIKSKLMVFGLVVVGVIFFASSLFILNAATGWLIGFIFSAVALFVGSGMVDLKSKKGNDIFYELLGLRMYINTAEKKRIEFHNDPETYRGVFERLLPYAMIFSLEKKWAGEFKDIYDTPPDWYVGNMDTFNAYMMTSAFTRMNSSIKSKSVQPGSSGGFRVSGGASGGSGFSGGSSGGGFGGGGGGSW